MARLTEKTLFYRHDHRDGFEFGAGEEPAAADGWVLDPTDIGPPPTRQFECTAPEAWECLLASERRSSVMAVASLTEKLRQVQAVALEAIAEVERLTAEIAALRAGQTDE